MGKWLSRGLGFAALMVVVRLIQGALINQFETQALLISVTVLTIFAIIALVWGYIDGRADARANIDPDRRDDLAMTWLVAGLVAGLLSGFVTWLISLLYNALYSGGLINELTTFAAFTALLVFLPAAIGVAVGRWLVDRNTPEVDRKAAREQDRADTDVFGAVRDDTPTGEIPVATAAEAQPSQVALAERDDDTVAEGTESTAKTKEEPRSE
ncbi:MAG TPA: B-4DMT family transporter [Mycobacterium sp.]|nr:B-4DMT family transporter [Mycobacterium sp.]